MTDLQQLIETTEQLREDVDYLMTLLEPELQHADPTTGSPTSTHPQPGPPQGSSPNPPAGAHVWQDLNPLQAAHAWTTLTDWVDWLTDRYQLHETLPVCWYRHGALIEELDALRAAWHSAYLDPTARPVDPAYWHELLARTLTRTRDWDRYGCTAGTHHQDLVAAPGSHDTSTRHSYLRDDLALRLTNGDTAPRPDGPIEPTVTLAGRRDPTTRKDDP